MPPKQPPYRLSDFSNPESIYTELQGHGKQGVLTSRTTHEGIEVSGNVPQYALPTTASTTNLSSIVDMTSSSAIDGDSLFLKRQLQELDTEQLYKNNVFLQSHLTTSPTGGLNHDHQQHQQQSRYENNNNYNTSSSPQQEPNIPETINTEVTSPPKTLNWLHSIIENFFEFRARQFEIKHSNSVSYALSDADDRASKMIVPSPISDDVAFHIFEMISERYGIPSVVAQQCDLILRTAKFYSTRDVSSALFFTLLKTPNFDSNDVRFVVEAKKAMRSSLVSQRGMDGVLRWFIPLRVVPYVIRKACEHPWARAVLAKCHSAFEKLLSVQRRNQMSVANNMNNNGRNRNTNSNNNNNKQPLFTLPAPNKLILNPPFGSDHPLVGRGPYVDVRSNELFLGAQPHQLVIGADYMLCMLFCNWLDHRENSVTDVAEGKPIRTIVNRRQGKVTGHRTLEGKDATNVSRLAMFAMDIDEDTGDFLQGGGFSKTHHRSNSNDLTTDDHDHSANTNNEDRSSTHTRTTSGGMGNISPALSSKKVSMADLHSLRNNSSNTAGFEVQVKGQTQRRELATAIVPPRVLHLYTK